MLNVNVKSLGWMMINNNACIEKWLQLDFRHCTYALRNRFLNVVDIFLLRSQLLDL